MMGFLEAVKSAYTNMFDFSGRADRPAFWWFQLYYLGLNFVIITIEQRTPWLAQQISGTLTLIALLHIFLTTSLWVRRLHDIGHSGWWFLIVFVPILGQLYLIYLAILSGTDGGNQYGPEPGYEGEFGWMSSLERSERMANLRLDSEDTLARFIEAYDQKDFQACWDTLLEVGVDNKEIHRLLYGIREEGYVPTAILARRQSVEN